MENFRKNSSKLILGILVVILAVFTGVNSFGQEKVEILKLYSNEQYVKLQDPTDSLYYPTDTYNESLLIELKTKTISVNDGEKIYTYTIFKRFNLANNVEEQDENFAYYEFEVYCPDMPGIDKMFIRMCDTANYIRMYNSSQLTMIEFSIDHMR